MVRLFIKMEKLIIFINEKKLIFQSKWFTVIMIVFK